MYLFKGPPPLRFSLLAGPPQVILEPPNLFAETLRNRSQPRALPLPPRFHAGKLRALPFQPGKLRVVTPLQPGNRGVPPHHLLPVILTGPSQVFFEARNLLLETRNLVKQGSYLRLIDFCITQL